MSHGDYQRVTDVRSSVAEIGDLADSFTGMRRSLQEIADQARQAGEERVDALHPCAGDSVADFGDAGRDSLERRLDGDVARRVAQAPGKLVARQHRVGNAAHHPVEQVDRQADRAERFLALHLGGRHHLGDDRCRGLLGKRGDQRLVVLARQRFPGFERKHQLSDPVDDREHGVDQPGVGDSLAGANLRLIGRAPGWPGTGRRRSSRGCCAAGPAAAR